jgi:hypothetical protein
MKITEMPGARNIVILFDPDGIETVSVTCEGYSLRIAIIQSRVS